MTKEKETANPQRNAKDAKFKTEVKTKRSKRTFLADLAFLWGLAVKVVKG